MQIKARSWNQFEIKAPEGLKGSQVYEIDFNAKGLLKAIIPVLDMFIARNHQKIIGITLINQSQDPMRIQ